MKASDRCKEHNQGDRCRTGENHTENTHQGNFNSWSTDENGLITVIRTIETN